jgi:hypothetical protein
MAVRGPPSAQRHGKSRACTVFYVVHVRFTSGSALGPRKSYFYVDGFTVLSFAASPSRVAVGAYMYSTA